VVNPTGIAKLAVNSLLALTIILKTHLRMELVVEAMASSAQAAALGTVVAALATVAAPPHIAALAAKVPLELAPRGVEADAEELPRHLQMARVAVRTDIHVRERRLGHVVLREAIAEAQSITVLKDGKCNIPSQADITI
jgi:hypothetical protein